MGIYKHYDATCNGRWPCCEDTARTNDDDFEYIDSPEELAEILISKGWTVSESGDEAICEACTRYYLLTFLAWCRVGLVPRSRL